MNFGATGAAHCLGILQIDKNNPGNTFDYQSHSLPGYMV